MSAFCSVVGCSKKAERNQIRYFRIPKALQNRGEMLDALSKERRENWVRALRRGNLSDTFLNNARISAHHFVCEFGNMNVLIKTGQDSYLDQLYLILRFGKAISSAVLKHKNVQQLLKSDEKFDLVILEQFLNEALVIFAHKFKCPLIFFNSVAPTFYNNYLFANHAPPSYIPNILIHSDDNMNFWERFENLYREIVGELYVQFRVLPQQEEILKEAMPDAPELKSMLYNASLMLTATHVSVGFPYPQQQNIKDIGGYHLLPPKPLPKELQDFMDNSTEGVVIFSMGSILESSNFDVKMRKAILNAFSKIKQKVLWKFGGVLDEIPANVRISSWLPQADILAHPNTVAFISHGGLLGTLEAIHYGVPILGIPVFWDQMRNMEIAARKGYGLKIPYGNLNYANFEFALNDILNNPKYRMTAKTRSAILRDEPIQHLDKAIFWIEYVIRHHGAPHLRSGAMKLKWYELYNVDIILFISSILILIFISGKIIFRNIFCKRTSVSEKKNQ